MNANINRSCEIKKKKLSDQPKSETDDMLSM